MENRFLTTHNQTLQNAYGAWAVQLPTNRIVAIALPDPSHAMAAFFACAHVGRRACIVSPEMLVDLDDTFAPLTTLLPPENKPQPIGASTQFITFTSGSTNRPKAILRDPKTWLYSFARNGVRPDDTVAVMGHLGHSLAHYVACEALHIGAKIIFCPKRLTGDPTIIYATPTQIKLATTKSNPKPNVRRVMIGGGHLSPQDHAHCQRQFPNADISVFYGTAETSFISMADAATPNGSVGRPYDGVDISFDGDAVCVQTPMLAQGYLNTRPLDPNKPYQTGELGWCDDVGNLFLHGRSDRAVTIADKTVHLDSIENDLRTNPNITHAGVIALTDDKRGFRAYGAVMGAETNHPLLAGSLVLNEWPMLLSGKTDYVRLKQILAQAFS
jgi:long-chain acyl-CoA synthetase